MANLITRIASGINAPAKNAPLTLTEMDNNLIGMNNEIITHNQYGIHENIILNGVTAGLHRSPNAITAMCVYDTSKDSDGGAWTKKCQGTSWYNETLSGNWLGAHATEVGARFYKATLGIELLTNNTFTSTGNWTAGSGATLSASNNKLTVTGAANTYAYQAITTEIGSTYLISGKMSDGTSAQLTVATASSGGTALGTTGTVTYVSDTEYKAFFVATGTTSYFRLVNVTGNNSFAEVSCRKVDTLSTQANDYFQLITDGKFYVLSKNLLTTTATLATQTQWLAAGTYTLSSTTGSSGSVVLSGAATGTHTAGTPLTFTVSTSGNVTFTVTGSVLTAQCELGSSATTYSANTSTTRYNQVYRGNKREFPKLSAIVAEASVINIYDLTEPNKPMWMRFTTSGYANIIVGMPIGTLYAIEGKLFSGSVTYDLSVVDFPKDSGLNYGSSAASGLYKGNISQRNNTLGLILGQGVPTIIHRAINAISACILPNAPIDPVTGLKIPTIAVGTGGGISVIKHDGTVVNSSSTLSYLKVVVDKNGVFTPYSTSFCWSSISNNANSSLLNTQNLSSGFQVSLNTSTDILDFNQGATTCFLSPTRSNFYRTSNALIQLLRNNEQTITKGLTATITNNYNTGYQVGDIRRTYLSDITAENIGPSTELVSNGTFDEVTPTTTGWITTGLFYPCTIAIVNNELEVTNIGTYGRTTYPVSTTIGKTYVLRVGSSRTIGTTSANMYMCSVSGGAATYASGYRNQNFVATQSTYWVTVGSNAGIAGDKTYFKNISVKEVVGDRSYKNSGALINGTLTKSAVNTGSDLVAYSGFSNSNYIREAYSSDLDFNQGEFSVSSWVNIPVTLSSAAQIISRSYSSGPNINLGITGDGYLTATVYDGTTTRSINSPQKYNTATWNKVRANYTTDGSLSLLVNGNEVAKTTGNPLLQLGAGWNRVADQLESQAYVYSLTVFNNELYAGTYPNGKLFKWNGTNAWIRVADQLESQTYIITLAVWNNELYGGTGTNGKLFKWNGTNAWVKVADQLESQTNIYSLAVWNNELYGGTGTNGKLFKYVPGTGWIRVADQLESQTNIYSLAVWNNELYGGTLPNGKLFKYVPETGWIRVADQLESQTDIDSLIVFNNELYGGTYNGGKLFKYVPGTGWIKVADQLEIQTRIHSLIVFNDELYGGTYSAGKLFKYVPETGWIRVADSLDSQIAIMSLGVFNNELYGTTGDKGKLFKFSIPASLPSLTIGNNYDLTAPFPGSLALTKFSGTVPTAEQGLWMYEQEKPLFNANTKCVLPDSGNIIDIAYNDVTNNWQAASSTYVSKWNGLVRVDSAAVSTGTFSKLVAGSNVQLLARITNQPGVDITIPTKGLSTELLTRNELANTLNANVVTFTFNAGFTADTVDGSGSEVSTSLTDVKVLTYPTSPIGAQITGTGITTGTIIQSLSGTTMTISLPATADGNDIQMQLYDYFLPVKYETIAVYVDGVKVRENTTWTRSFDGFKEKISFITAPAFTAVVQIQAISTI